jgi:hypothetical protein
MGISQKVCTAFSKAATYTPWQLCPSLATLAFIFKKTNNQGWRKVLSAANRYA